MSWDTNQAITSTTPGGGRSKSNCARPKDFLPSTSTPRPDITRQRTSRSLPLAKFSLVLPGLMFFLLVASSTFAQITVQTPPPPPPPGQEGGVSQSGGKIKVDVNLVVLHTTVLRSEERR